MKVMKRKCDQCLFTKNKIVSDKRKQDIIQSTVAKQGFFECHKATIAGEKHCCRGYFDQLGHTSQMVRIAGRLGTIEFSLPEKNQ